MKRKMSFLVAGLCACPFALGAEAAGTVTGTLTVRVRLLRHGSMTAMWRSRPTTGASSMTPCRCTTRPIPSSAARTTGTCNTVIDSAYGFYLADLLDYAGIYSGDIAVVAFYTRDQSVGFFTSFTYADLFGTQRYYYNDLSAHISPVYDENGTLTGYDGDEAWNDCWTVQPMLALEDSWVSYEIGTEHTAPNYSSLGTGNRFRLLFGQSYPLECPHEPECKIYAHAVHHPAGHAEDHGGAAGAGRHARLAFGDISDFRRPAGSARCAGAVSGHRLVRQLRSGDHRHHRHAGRAVFRALRP